jgi:hypothetical protein
MSIDHVTIRAFIGPDVDELERVGAAIRAFYGVA